jgi:hypothetical protein
MDDHQGGIKMTKAENKAIKARTQDLINQGIEKELAKVMARTELECGLIKVVVNY